MKIDGSCHCGAVRFSVQSPQPYPFNLCYCSICRKTAGGGGYAISASMFIPRSRLQPGISGSGSSKVSSAGRIIGMIVLGDRRITTRNGPLYADNAKLFRSGAGGT